MAEIMTTKELSGYLSLHEITICRYAAEGVIPGKRIGKVWRFDKDEIDDWITKGYQIKRKGTRKRKTGKSKSR